MMLTKLKEKFTSLKEGDEENPYKLWGTVIVILGLTAAMVQWNKYNPQETKVVEDTTSADTYIPKRHTLVPIEVANYESLDSIIGQFGVVDLFSTPLNPQEKSKRIAFSVKILRAPRNPSHFAVLMPEAEAHIIAGHIGPITVTVRNPKESGTKIVHEKRRKKKRRISYDFE
ncbi:MAG: hypothetical protein HRT44_01755 [Bdellovibrionales bacterium]|nr:hypothetical protein [Bdellovibrionales bacterium]NQZ17971.1 hypothetical protein [Bdellovibrionales bacterium]